MPPFGLINGVIWALYVIIFKVPSVFKMFVFVLLTCVLVLGCGIGTSSLLIFLMTLNLQLPLCLLICPQGILILGCGLPTSMVILTFLRHLIWFPTCLLSLLRIFPTCFGYGKSLVTLGSNFFSGKSCMRGCLFNIFWSLEDVSMMLFVLYVVQRMRAYSTFFIYVL